MVREWGAELVGLSVIVDQLAPAARSQLSPVSALLAADELPRDRDELPRRPVTSEQP